MKCCEGYKRKENANARCKKTTRLKLSPHTFLRLTKTNKNPKERTCQTLNQNKFLFYNNIPINILQNKKIIYPCLFDSREHIKKNQKIVYSNSLY